MKAKGLREILTWREKKKEQKKLDRSCRNAIGKRKDSDYSILSWPIQKVFINFQNAIGKKTCLYKKVHG